MTKCNSLPASTESRLLSKVEKVLEEFELMRKQRGIL